MLIETCYNGFEFHRDDKTIYAMSGAAVASAASVLAHLSGSQSVRLLNVATALTGSPVIVRLTLRRNNLKKHLADK